MNTFEHVSASQISTYLGCRRKWWVNRILGLPIPGTDATVLGGQVHKGQEDYLDTGDEAAVHRLAKATLPLLRELRGNVFVEKPMERVLRNGIKFVGRIDIMDLKLKHVPRIIDWKTTSDTTYAKTEEELRTDIQMLAYAYETQCITPSKEVIVAHYALPTRKGAPRYTEAVVTVQEVARGWTRIQDIVDEMRETARAQNVTDVPPTESNCYAYNKPCPFLTQCQALKGTNPYASFDQPKEASMPQLDEATIISLFGADKSKWPPGMEAAPSAAPAAKAATILPPEAPNPRAAASTADTLGYSWWFNPSTNEYKRVEGFSNLSAPWVGVGGDTDKKIHEESRARVQVATADEKALLLAQNGWTEEDINKMADDVFNLVADKNQKKDDCEWDEVDDAEAPGGKGITNVRKKKPAKVEPVAEAAPRTRTRGVAPVVANPEPAPSPPVVKTEAARVEENVAAPEPAAEKGGRQPRNAIPRLLALGYPQAVIDGMDKAEMRRILPEKGAEIPYVAPVDIDPEEAEQAAREARAEQAAQAAGIPPKVAGGTEPIIAQQPTALDVVMRDARIKPLEETLAGETAMVLELEGRVEEMRVAATKGGGAGLTVANNRIAVLEAEATICEANYTALRAENARLAGLVERQAVGGFTLYVDCIPEKGIEYTMLEDALRPIQEHAAKTYRNDKGEAQPLTHYGLIPFGKGPAVVAANVMANLSHIAKGAVVVNSRSPCAMAVLEVLWPAADAVVSARGR